MAPLVYTEAARYDSKGGERFPAGARLMLVQGGAARALVPEFAASADAAVSFDGARVLFAGKQKPGEPWQIWEIAVAGGTPRRITSGSDDCIRPFYMPADNLVYARRTKAGFEIELAPLAGGTPLRLTYGYGDHTPSDVLLDGRVLFDAPHPSGAREVYTVYADGSGVEAVRCDHGHDRHSARQVASGDVLFVSGTRLARFTSARAVELPLALPKGEYAGPVAELSPGDLLVSWRAAAGAPFTLRRVKIGDTQPAPETVAAGVEPVILRAHAVPKRHPSGLGDRSGGNILCLNVYTSREGGIPEGVVTTVRVWAQDDAGAPMELGRAPVEKDGSFFVQVPSERPIRFELLDGNSKTVRAAQGWFWMRRGEQRVCVGCHAGPERAPDNAVPAVLLRTTDPVKMCGNCHADRERAREQAAPIKTNLPVH